MRVTAGALAGLACCALLVVLGRAAAGGGDAAADCAAPELRVVGGAVLPRGQVVTLRGRFYLSDRWDSGRIGSQPPPYASVRITITPRGGHARPFATVHPRRNGAFHVEVAVPEDLQRGPAVVRDAVSGRPLDVVIR